MRLLWAASILAVSTFLLFGICANASDFFTECKEAAISEYRLHPVHRDGDGNTGVRGYSWVTYTDASRIGSRLRFSELCMQNIDITGEIKTGDAILLKRALELLNPFVGVALDSPGGDAYEAMKMGRLLAEKNTWVTVARDQVCASACVLIYAAGTHKSLTDRGRLAIHRFEFIDATKAAALSPAEYRTLYGSALDEVKSYLKGMGIREELADEMMRYSSDEVHFLTREEIAFYGLNQDNPYKYEQDKARWIARCGKDWWTLMQTLEKTSTEKCLIMKEVNGQAELDVDAMQNCNYELMAPLYKMCGLEFPK